MLIVYDNRVSVYNEMRFEEVVAVGEKSMKQWVA